MRFPNISPISNLHNSKKHIKESSLKGNWINVLTHYTEINKAGFQLEEPTLLPPIFKACANLHSFQQGTSFHSCIIKQGWDSFTSIGNSIIDFYMKCGVLTSAMRVFASMEDKDSVTWNIVINGCFKQDNSNKGLCMFVQGRAAGFEPNISTLVLVLQACRGFGGVNEGLSIHGFLIRSGFLFDVSVQNSLLSFYSEFVGIVLARKLFDEMLVKDVVSWSVMIEAFLQSGQGLNTLLLFQEMLFDIRPDEFTVVSIVKTCTNLRDVRIGRSIHCFVICEGFDFDTFVGNSLVDMYSKCADVDSAYKVFNGMSSKNIVSWNSMLSGLVHVQKYVEALALFPRMNDAKLEGDEVTMVALLQISKGLGDIYQCKSIHSRVIRKEFESNELVQNALIDAYAKCGHVEIAWGLFRQLESKDPVSWSTMIAAFSHSGRPGAAVSLFQEMTLLQEKFNSITMLSLLEACSLIADLERSKWAHGVAIRNGMAAEVAIGTALLNMYAKCGALDASRKVFDQMPDRNIVSWSAMIAAYGTNGRVCDALSLFREMDLHGLKPNAVTMISVLTACSHGGLIEEGYSCFRGMVGDHSLQPSMEHYSCMVDMLGRAGYLDSAMDVIRSIPAGANVGASVWGTLLSACRNHGNSELGGEAVSHVLELEPSNSAGYVLASSMYSSNGMWNEAARMRRMVKDKGVKVVAGYSLVHAGNRAYRFVADDDSHPHSEEIHAVVENLHSYMELEEKHEFIM